MEDQLNKYFPEYEKLLKTKDYHMLSDLERSIVSLFTSKEEYKRIRKIILSNKETTDEARKTIEPNPKIVNNLINVMKTNKSSSGASRVVKNIFEYKIRAYQFALFAAALILFVLFFYKEKIVTVKQPDYVYNTDTLEKYIVEDAKSNIQRQAQINFAKKSEQETLNKETAPDITRTSNYNSSSINNLGLPRNNADLKEKIENFKQPVRTIHDDSSILKYFDKI
jgi:hypothetical protein